MVQANALPGADDAEPGCLVEGQAGGVLGEDARQQLPEAARRIGVDQPGEGGVAGTAAARRPVDIDGMLGDAVIAGTAAIGPGGGEGYDAAAALDDDGRIALALVAQLRLDLRRRARRRLEGGDAIGDALVVDLGDGLGIGRCRQADGGGGGHGLHLCALAAAHQWLR